MILADKNISYRKLCESYGKRQLCILTNKNNTTLYVSVTANLSSRIYQHTDKINSQSFTPRYNLDKLVYFESFTHIQESIARKKQLKAGSRKKELLINKLNPQ